MWLPAPGTPRSPRASASSACPYVVALPCHTGPVHYSHSPLKFPPVTVASQPYDAWLLRIAVPVPLVPTLTVRVDCIDRPETTCSASAATGWLASPYTAVIAKHRG
eukprot:scaffold5021_cov123-Isochrysis_galbana.AAC.2